jgi:hypothetical protein
MISKPSPRLARRTGPLTSSAAETHARATVMPGPSIDESTRILRFTSSGLLKRFALALFSARIRPLSALTPLGLGGGFDLASNRLVTLSCPSDSGPVALALTTEGIGCSCSARFPTPTASDWKGSTGSGSRRGTLAEWLATRSHPDGTTLYPHPEFYEQAMGFPIGWTEPEGSAMP